MGACWSCCRECLDLPPPVNEAAVDLTHFALHRVLGRGGFGKVQVVQSRLNNDYYALKSISKAWLVQSASNVQSVWLERHIMIQIRSPFLVPVYFAFQDARNIYLVMHFLPGGDLHFLLQNKRLLAKGKSAAATANRRKLPEWHARFYMAEILLALEEMHSFGLVYRDLKPENVLLDAQGHVRLSDFGLAGDLNVEGDGKTVGACGTMGYQSQELLANMRYDTTPDVFAFGVVLYELLHGQVPQQIEQDPELEVHFSQKVSPACRDLILQLLQPDPMRRIGCDPSLPFGERWGAVKAHPFFAGLDWSVVARKGLEPPFIPEADTANCDPMYELEEQLREPPVENPVSPEEDAVFRGWDWHTEPHFHTKRSNISLAGELMGAHGSSGGESGEVSGEHLNADGRHHAPQTQTTHARQGSEGLELMAARSGGGDDDGGHHHRHLTSSSFHDSSHADFGPAVSVMPAAASAASVAADSSSVVVPPRNIHQNPDIDAYTHYFRESPTVVRPVPDTASSELSPVELAAAAEGRDRDRDRDREEDGVEAALPRSFSPIAKDVRDLRHTKLRRSSPSHSPPSSRRASSVQVPAHSTRMLQQESSPPAGGASPQTEALAKSLHPLVASPGGTPATSASRSTPELQMLAGRRSNAATSPPGRNRGKSGGGKGGVSTRLNHQPTSSMEEDDLAVITLQEFNGAAAADDAHHEQIELEWHESQ